MPTMPTESPQATSPSRTLIFLSNFALESVSSVLPGLGKPRERLLYVKPIKGLKTSGPLVRSPVTIPTKAMMTSARDVITSTVTHVLGDD